MSRPPIIISTLGDAAGIGPEIAVRSLLHPEATAGVKRIIVGPRSLFDLGCASAKTRVELPVSNSLDEAIARPENTVLFDFDPTNFAPVPMGKSSREAGHLDLAIARIIIEAHASGKVDGFVFAPVNKLSLKMAGSDFEGYKAYIADGLGCTSSSAEINTIGDLWTTRVSSHVSIAEVPNLVTRENVLDVIRYFHRELKRFGYENPRIAVSGLNPHNGDGGMFGREEIDHIEPAIAEAIREGISAEGPYPADTIFLTVRDNEIPAVVSMYHDQCQIATKLLNFDEGVTYFGGLPFPITTPAHGTAYDIAGSGKASEKQFTNALALMRKAVLNARGSS